MAVLQHSTPLQRAGTLLRPPRWELHKQLARTDHRSKPYHRLHTQHICLNVSAQTTTLPAHPSGQHTDTLHKPKLCVASKNGRHPIVHHGTHNVMVVDALLQHSCLKPCSRRRLLPCWVPYLLCQHRCSQAGASRQNAGPCCSVIT